MRRKTLLIAMAGLMALSLTACGKSSTETAAQIQAESTTAATASETESTEETSTSSSLSDSALPDGTPTDFIFSSGAGAWSTELTLDSDGTFTGSYHDSDMGDSDDTYPNGTVYYSNFSGSFTDIHKVDETTYEMTLSDVTTDEESGTETIEDDIRYVASSAYGVDTGSACHMYLPGTDKSVFSEESLFWLNSYDCFDSNDQLTIYVICNDEPEYVFAGFGE